MRCVHAYLDQSLVEELRKTRHFLYHSAHFAARVACRPCSITGALRLEFIETKYSLATILTA